MSRRALILVGLFFALAVPAALVAHQEFVLRAGERVFLALAPVDPRSLIEGDYMRLTYEVANEVHRHRASVPADGYLVVGLDAERRARFVRLDGGEMLRPGELRLRYRRRHGFARVGSDAYYFQEGKAERFTRAKFGELRVTGSGESVLVGLCDQALMPLGR